MADIDTDEEFKAAADSLMAAAVRLYPDRGEALLGIARATIRGSDEEMKLGLSKWILHILKIGPRAYPDFRLCKIIALLAAISIQIGISEDDMLSYLKSAIRDARHLKETPERPVSNNEN